MELSIPLRRCGRLRPLYAECSTAFIAQDPMRISSIHHSLPFLPAFIVAKPITRNSSDPRKGSIDRSLYEVPQRLRGSQASVRSVAKTQNERTIAAVFQIKQEIRENLSCNEAVMQFYVLVPADKKTARKL